MDDIRNILDRHGKHPRKPVTLSAVDYGKIPPQATDLEEAVLGALMLEKDAYKTASALLKPEIFYKPNHQKVYTAIHHLRERNEPVDILTVTNQLKSQGDLDIIGGPYFIAQLTSRVGSAANIEYHCRILQEKFIKRELIRIASQITNQAFEEGVDVFDILEELSQETHEITQLVTPDGVKLPMALYEEYNTQIEEALKNGGKMSGSPTATEDLDAKTNGWQPGTFIIVAARPAMGKTGFMLSDALRTVKLTRKPVVIFSLEMSAVELFARMVAAETGISAWDAMKGRVDDNFFAAMQELASFIHNNGDPLIIFDDTPGQDVFRVSAKLRKYHEQYGVTKAYIDYLQLMIPKEAEADEVRRAVSVIGKECKGVSRELKIPVIGFSQLSRKVEERKSKRPELQDLRESGTLEEDADMVCFLFRPEYYYKMTKQDDFKEIQIDGRLISSEGVGEIIIAKARSGPPDSSYAKFNAESTAWVDLTPDDF